MHGQKCSLQGTRWTEMQLAQQKDKDFVWGFQTSSEGSKAICAWNVEINDADGPRAQRLLPCLQPSCKQLDLCLMCSLPASAPPGTTQGRLPDTKVGCAQADLCPAA